MELLQKENYQIEISKPQEASEEGGIDIEQYSRDEIVKFIGRKFKGHDLARLVEAVLSAQGYVTLKSDPGPDGGVDGSGSDGGSPSYGVPFSTLPRILPLLSMPPITYMLSGEASATPT